MHNECFGCSKACCYCSGVRLQSVKLPKQVCFHFWVQMSKLGSLCSDLGVGFSFLAPDEVESRGSIHLDGKPLPQGKPSASKCDATCEVKKNLRPKTLCESY